MIILDNLVDFFESQVAGDFDKCICVMLSCVVLVENHLPDVGYKSISIAKNYWLDGKKEQESLKGARVECWNYLDERNASTNTQEKRYCALRAVICTLYAEMPSDDIGEFIEFFLEMVSEVEEDLELLHSVIVRGTKERGSI